MIDTKLRTNGKTSRWLRHCRLDAQAEGGRAVSRPATADSARINRCLTIECAHRIVRISKLRDEETFVVAPDFPPNLRSYFVSDRISKILRHAEAVGIGKVITRIVHIGDRRQFVP